MTTVPTDWPGDPVVMLLRRRCGHVDFFNGSGDNSRLDRERTRFRRRQCAGCRMRAVAEQAAIKAEGEAKRQERKARHEKLLATHTQATRKAIEGRAFPPGTKIAMIERDGCWVGVATIYDRVKLRDKADSPKVLVNKMARKWLRRKRKIEAVDPVDE